MAEYIVALTRRVDGCKQARVIHQDRPDHLRIRDGGRAGRAREPSGRDEVNPQRGAGGSWLSHHRRIAGGIVRGVRVARVCHAGQIRHAGPGLGFNAHGEGDGARSSGVH